MEEESPYFEVAFKENVFKMPKLNKNSSKEQNIINFLDEMWIEQIVPGEINHIKLKFGKSISELTPKLKLNQNSLFQKRKKSIKPINELSDYM